MGQGERNSIFNGRKAGIGVRYPEADNANVRSGSISPLRPAG
jgi:hypothetical protein